MKDLGREKRAQDALIDFLSIYREEQFREGHDLGYDSGFSAGLKKVKEKTAMSTSEKCLWSLIGFLGGLGLSIIILSWCVNGRCPS